MQRLSQTSRWAISSRSVYIAWSWRPTPHKHQRRNLLKCTRLAFLIRGILVESRETDFGLSWGNFLRSLWPADSDETDIDSIARRMQTRAMSLQNATMRLRLPIRWWSQEVSSSHIVGSAELQQPSQLSKTLLRLLLPQALQNLPPLRHHVSVQHISARHIDSQNSPESPRPLLTPMPARRRDGRVHQPALARDAHGVQDKESVVAEPCQPARDAAEVQAVSEVAVSDDFGGTPGEQHGGESGRGGSRFGEVEGDAPDQEEARGDLHEGGEEGSANDTCVGVMLALEGSQVQVTSHLPSAECTISNTAAVCT
jgi:hypothetical protein